MKPTLPPPNMSPTPEVEDNGCFDCHMVETTYMVKDKVWDEAFPTYKEEREKRQLEIVEAGGDEFRLETHGRLFLCFPCLEKKLGRNLTLDDFVPWEQAPCNRAVWFGAGIQ